MRERGEREEEREREHIVLYKDMAFAVLLMDIIYKNF